MTDTYESALQEEREFFLRSLRDLETEYEAGDIDEADYRVLRDDYVSRAADVLRRLQRWDDEAAAGHGSAVESDAAVEGDADVEADAAAGGEEGARDLGDEFDLEAGAGFEAGAGDGDSGGDAALESSGDSQDEQDAERRSVFGRSGTGRASKRKRPWTLWQKVALIVAVICLAAATGWELGKGSSSRLAGQTITGKSLGSRAVAQLLVDGQNAASKDPVTALKDFNKILAVYPDQPQALTDEGWVLAQAGIVSQGEADLKRAEQVAPTYDLPHAYLGLIMGDQGDYTGAVSELQYYLSHGPEQALVSQARAALAAAQKDLAATKAGTGG